MANKRISENASVVERSDSDRQCNSAEMKHYAEQMKAMFGDTQLPAVVYKGQTIPRRVLSDYSYLTR